MDSFLLSVIKQTETVSAECLELPGRKAPGEAKRLFYDNKGLEAVTKTSAAYRLVQSPCPARYKVLPCESGDGAPVQATESPKGFRLNCMEHAQLRHGTTECITKP